MYGSIAGWLDGQRQVESWSDGWLDDRQTLISPYRK